MASTILTNWTVYYDGETAGSGNSDYHIKWTGTTGTNTVLELYDALQDLFDAAAQMDNGTPMRLRTPTLFDIGQIETNETESWFIDPESIKHLTGAGINTVGWDFVSGTRRGIVKVPFTRVNINTADTNFTATTNATGTPTGKVLYITDTEVWLRPDTNTDDWTATANGNTITINGNTDTITGAGTTGNNIWSNIFTLGTLVSGTQLYVAQDQTVIANSEASGGGLWWGPGQLDILVATTDQGTLLDNGFLTVYARRETDLYDNFVVDASLGGRNAVPLATQDDLNNTTSVTTLSGFSVSFGGFTADVDQNTVNEDYSIQINGGSNTLQQVYQHLQYLTRRGSTTSFNGLEGQQYIGIDNYITFSGGVTGTVNTGDEVTGSVSGATGYVAHVNTTASPNYVTLHNSQGTFQIGENLTIGANSINTTSGVESIAPNKTAPFGTFAGGTFFLARGVVITNVNVSGGTYQTITDQGTAVSPPTTISFSLTGIQTGSEVRVFSNDSSVANTRDNELYGVEILAGTSITFSYTVSGSTISYTRNFGDNNDGKSFTLTAPSSITVVIFDLNFKEVRLTTLSLGTTDQSIPVQQITDRNYLTGSV